MIEPLDAAKVNERIRQLMERNAELVEAIRYGVDIHTPGRIDGPTYHHIEMWLKQCRAALANNESQP